MKWITREKIKVDRVACPWLIQHFVDPAAEFIFLPHGTDWTQIEDEIVFDVPNCELGHHGFALPTRTRTIPIQREKGCAGLPAASAL